MGAHGIPWDTPWENQWDSLEISREFPRNPTVCHGVPVSGDPAGTIGITHGMPCFPVGRPTGCRGSPMGSRGESMGSRGSPMGSPGGPMGSPGSPMGSHGNPRTPTGNHTIMSIATYQCPRAGRLYNASSSNQCSDLQRCAATLSFTMSGMRLLWHFLCYN